MILHIPAILAPYACFVLVFKLRKTEFNLNLASKGFQFTLKREYIRVQCMYLQSSKHIEPIQTHYPKPQVIITVCPVTQHASASYRGSRIFGHYYLYVDLGPFQRFQKHPIRCPIQVLVFWDGNLFCMQVLQSCRKDKMGFCEFTQHSLDTKGKTFLLK